MAGRAGLRRPAACGASRAQTEGVWYEGPPSRQSLAMCCRTPRRYDDLNLFVSGDA